MFVQWSCGCIGLLLDDVCIVIDECDGPDTLSFKPRPDLADKSYHPISRGHRADLIEKMETQMVDGYKWETFLELVHKDD